MDGHSNNLDPQFILLRLVKLLNIWAASMFGGMVALVIALVTGTWVLSGDLARVEAGVERNADAIARNAVAIDRNAAAIRRNAEAIGDLQQTMARHAGQHEERSRNHPVPKAS